MVNIGETLLSDTTFAVIDLETSGGSPKSGAGITEIGVVKVRGGVVLGTFQSFVDPGHSLPPFITQLTGITNEMLVSAPFIDEVLPTLFEFLGSKDETVLVAHNSPFDMSFLKAAALAHEYPWPNYLTIDTARLARAVLDRDEVINYARTKYGSDHVAHICTFNKTGARQSIRDAARALGYDFAGGDVVAKLVPPPVLGISKNLSECMEVEEFKQL